jgi:hypothetical protein
MASLLDRFQKVKKRSQKQSLNEISKSIKRIKTGRGQTSPVVGKGSLKYEMSKLSLKEYL